jgi:predicted dehydrogenase
MIRAGVVGCGGRGTGAIVNLLSGDPNAEVVAMGDIFRDKLETSLARLRDPAYVSRVAKEVPEFTNTRLDELVPSIQKRVKVDPERQFVGFDAYRQVLAAGVDVVLLCTPPGYRPLHFEAAVEAGKHTFVEKPIATDPVGVRRFLAAARTAQQKKLTVMSGAQRRSSRDYLETVKKIHDGALGEIQALYAQYLSRPVMHAKARDPKWGDMEWQHRNWYAFVWICGDQIVEQHFHNIDCINWIMDAHPVRVVAHGGASWRPREELYGNIYDHLTSEFTYPNGVRLSSQCRQLPAPAYTNVSDLVVGTKGRSNGRDLGAPGLNGQVREHIHMLASIRGDGPYVNHAIPVAESTLTAIMARESAYSGAEVTWEQAMASDQDLQPKSFDYGQKMASVPIAVPGVYRFA